MSRSVTPDGDREYQQLNVLPNIVKQKIGRKALEENKRNPQPGVTQKKYKHKSKQNRIGQIYEGLRNTFCDILADKDELLKDKDTLSVNCKNWLDLNSITPALNQINNKHKLRRLKIVLSKKNDRQYKGFVVFFRVPESRVAASK